MNPIRKNLEAKIDNQVYADLWHDEIEVDFTSELDPELNTMYYKTRHKVKVGLTCNYVGYCDPGNEIEIKNLENRAINVLEDEFYGFILLDLYKLAYMISARASHEDCVNKIDEIIRKIRD
jgi:hypothetical protein